MSESASDVSILRDLAKRYRELSGRPEMNRRRAAWRALNSLRPQAPLIYVRAFAWGEMPESRCLCQDRFLRGYEYQLRERLFHARFGDDFIYEPWLTVGATYRCTGWGVAIARQHSEEAGGSFKVDYPLKTLADRQMLRMPSHEVDEAATQASAQKLGDALGDLLTVNVDRAPAYRMWTGDLSTDLGYLRGIENFMLDMVDDPEGLRELVQFMQQGVLGTHEQAEKAGHWNLSAHQNQAMAYAQELQDPAANRDGVSRKQLWGYMASQEFTLVGPEMWNEFLLQYQKPILEQFGLAAYGCCEDLTRKIPYLRAIQNLRRIAVTPFADVARCAEQIGRDYVVSYRPSPADMVGYGWDEQRVRSVLKRDFAALKVNACTFDITLKDVETVQRDPERVGRWVQVVRQELAAAGIG